MKEIDDSLLFNINFILSFKCLKFKTTSLSYRVLSCDRGSEERIIISSFGIRFRCGNTRITNQRAVAFIGETPVAHYHDLYV